MKFGRNYHVYQIPEWANAHINYDFLKQACKEPASINFPDLLMYCTKAIDAVETFWDNNYRTVLCRRPRGSANDNFNPTFVGRFNEQESDPAKLHDLQTVLEEIIVDMDRLRWYGYVNAYGFRRIIRKIDSLGPQANDTAIQIGEYLCKKKFSTQNQCLNALESLSQALNQVVRSQQDVSPAPFRMETTFGSSITKLHQSIDTLPTVRAIDRNDSSELEKCIHLVYQQISASSRLQFIQALFDYSVQHLSHTSLLDILMPYAAMTDAEFAFTNFLSDATIKLDSRLGQRRCQGRLRDQALCFPSFVTVKPFSQDWQRILFSQDSRGRILLHYTCDYGLVHICKISLDAMQAWDTSSRKMDSRVAVVLSDKQLRNPLQLSILRGNLQITKLLLKYCGPRGDGCDEAPARQICTALSESLSFAIRTNSTEVVALLLQMDIDINYSDTLGQTSLYLAARSGNEAIVKLLLTQKPLLEKAESVKNRTPLTIASLEGFSTISECLLKQGANVEHKDFLGWTAIEHASYQGHVTLAKKLLDTTKNYNQKQAREIHHRLKAFSKQILPRNERPPCDPSSVESRIIVYLGSSSVDDHTPPIRLSTCLMEYSPVIRPESLFSLGVSVLGSTNSCHSISLPPLEDTTNTPWILSTTDPHDASLVFEIFRNQPENAKAGKLIGCATLEHIATVSFRFLISTPLALPDTPPVNTGDLWSENGRVKVVGHRGLGQNMLPSTRLQVGENSLQSFMSAVDLGASYVEACQFGLTRKPNPQVVDVQLTKDHVPVIYHDFLVSETGIDIPMHTITYKQLIHIHDEQSPKRLPPGNVETKRLEAPFRKRARSSSATPIDSIQTKTLMDRVKHTFDHNSRRLKGNTRGDFIHDAIVHFEEVFTQLPPHIGLDVELKYPLLSEATNDWQMDPFFVEANFFVDTILLCLAKHISNRPVFLSCFSPEICILLTLKQSRWPVFFGNDCGNWKPTAILATSLQEGLKFAKAWGLQGLALTSEPFVYAPQLFPFVKEVGMVCATYGTLNDEREGLEIQGTIGVNILIVNNVRLASEVLDELEESAPC